MSRLSESQVLGDEQRQGQQYDGEEAGKESLMETGKRVDQLLSLVSCRRGISRSTNHVRPEFCRASSKPSW